MFRWAHEVHGTEEGFNGFVSDNHTHASMSCQLHLALYIKCQRLPQVCSDPTGSSRHHEDYPRRHEYEGRRIHAISDAFRRHQVRMQCFQTHSALGNIRAPRFLFLFPHRVVLGALLGSSERRKQEVTSMKIKVLALFTKSSKRICESK